MPQEVPLPSIKDVGEILPKEALIHAFSQAAAQYPLVTVGLILAFFLLIIAGVLFVVLQAWRLNCLKDPTAAAAIRAIEHDSKVLKAGLNAAKKAKKRQSKQADQPG